MALQGIGALLHLRHLNRRRNEELNLERRLRDESNPFELTDIEYDRETARFIINRLRVRLSPKRSDGLSPKMKVLITLRFLGFGSYQRVVGQGFFLASVSQPSTSRCIIIVTRYINDMFLNETVRFPSTVAERETVSRRFLEPAGFPGILGCIDCTHVAIVTPYVQEDAFKNHHGYYSLNVQMICDERLRILNVNANFPGSVHDQFIFNASQVKQEMTRLHEDRIGIFFLLVRNRVERLFGVLKGRLRCLKSDRILHYQPEAAASIVYSCAILHNLLLDRVPILDDKLYDIEIQPIQGNNRNGYAEAAVDGEIVRNHIINRYFND